MDWVEYPVSVEVAYPPKRLGGTSCLVEALLAPVCDHVAVLGGAVGGDLVVELGKRTHDVHSQWVAYHCCKDRCRFSLCNRRRVRLLHKQLVLMPSKATPPFVRKAANHLLSHRLTDSLTH